MAAIWNSTWDPYNEWYNKMLGSGQYWNDADLFHASQDRNFADTVFNAKNDYINATTDEGRALANANAEAARKNYGYTSGTAGAEYNPFGNGVATPGGGSSYWGGEMQATYNNMKNQPDFSYDPYQGLPEWQHSDAYNRTFNDVLNYGDFSYDYTTDPLYDVYAKAYTREGRRASEDALAQAAAMTGGVPSSYANTAAQQAGNYYAAQLADKIPELRAQAYSEYNNKFNQLMSKHGVANAGDQFDYGVYRDRANQDYQQYLDDLNMRYGIYSDAFNRNADLYNIASGNYWQMHGEDLDQAAQEDAKRLEYAEMLAKLGDYSALAEYYGDDGRLLAAWEALNAPTGGGYYGLRDDGKDKDGTGVPFTGRQWEKVNPTVRSYDDLSPEAQSLYMQAMGGSNTYTGANEVTWSDLAKQIQKIPVNEQNYILDAIEDKYGLTL